MKIFIFFETKNPSVREKYITFIKSHKNASEILKNAWVIESDKNKEKLLSQLLFLSSEKDDCIFISYYEEQYWVSMYISHEITNFLR